MRECCHLAAKGYIRPGIGVWSVDTRSPTTDRNRNTVGFVTTAHASHSAKQIPFIHRHSSGRIRDKPHLVGCLRMSQGRRQELLKRVSVIVRDYPILPIRINISDGIIPSVTKAVECLGIIPDVWSWIHSKKAAEGV